MTSTRGPRDDGPVLTFLGAAGTVTGSKFLVDTPTARVLVDCGLYQGPKELRLRNWAPFPVDPASIDAVVLTHAHIDHSGHLPALVQHGFSGKIHASPNSAALAGIVLPDSGHLQEEDAAYANRRGFSKHAPALPLYTEQDARDSLRSFHTVAFGTTVDIADGVRATLTPAGHILGSSIVTLDLDGPSARRLVFSGDLGRSHHPLLLPPGPIDGPDAVLVESTYGDRTHDDAGSLELFAETIRRTAARGGVVVIPAFAVDRTEVLLLHLKALRSAGAIPDLPIYVDSPMALATLDVYQRAIDDGEPEIRPEVRNADDPFGLATVHPMHKVEESKQLDELTAPAIIVSASGMATGGRVLHHLRRYLPDHRASIVLVGFQAEQTRGRRLLDGARQVKLLGNYVSVRAEVVNLPAFSVHADHDELLAWLATADAPPATTFVVHGEPHASDRLRESIDAELGWNAVVPTYAERVVVDHRGDDVAHHAAPTAAPATPSAPTPEEQVPEPTAPAPVADFLAREGGRPLTVDEELLAGPDRDLASLLGNDPIRVARMRAELIMGFRTLAGVGRAVSVFGSSRTPVDSPDYELARRTTALLGERGFAIISGGGPGTMQAANQGARDAGALSIGLGIELPRQQAINPYVDLALEFKHFYIRKVMFVRYASAFVVFPGGLGTLDELFEALSLIQTAKIQHFPLVLVGSHFWEGLLRWARDQLLGTDKLSPDDLALFQVVDTPEEVAAIAEAAFGRQDGVAAPVPHPH